MSDLSGSDPFKGDKTRTDCVVAVATRQWGVISAAQLRRCGVDAKTVSRWVAARRLHRIHRGVYAVGHCAMAVEGLLVAALIHAGPGAALSHTTAAWWWQLIPHRPEVIEVSGPGDVRSITGVVVRHPRRLAVARHRLLPVTTIPQTFRDFASQAEPRVLRQALAEADYRGLLNLDAVRGALGQGHPGSHALRAALADHEPRYGWTKSRLERAFLRLCERNRIPLPQVNVRIAGWLVDAVWPVKKVIVELDGYANHRTRAQLNRDHQRDLELRAAGFTIVRYTEAQIAQHAERVAEDLGRLLDLA